MKKLLIGFATLIFVSGAFAAEYTMKLTKVTSDDEGINVVGHEVGKPEMQLYIDRSVTPKYSDNLSKLSVVLEANKHESEKAYASAPRKSAKITTSEVDGMEVITKVEILTTTAGK